MEVELVDIEALKRLGLKKYLACNSKLDKVANLNVLYGIFSDQRGPLDASKIENRYNLSRTKTHECLKQISWSRLKLYYLKWRQWKPKQNISDFISPVMSMCSWFLRPGNTESLWELHDKKPFIQRLDAYWYFNPSNHGQRNLVATLG